MANIGTKQYQTRNQPLTLLASSSVSPGILLSPFVPELIETVRIPNENAVL